MFTIVNTIVKTFDNLTLKIRSANVKGPNSVLHLQAIEKKEIICDN